MVVRTFSGEQLRQVRLRRGWSQDELARRVPTSVTNLSRWERDRHRPGANMVARLASALRCEESDLYGDNGEGEDEDEEADLHSLTFEDVLAVLNFGLTEMKRKREPI